MDHSCAGPLWYIQMLWIFSVLLVWVRRVEKDRLWKLGEKANVLFLVLFAIVIWGAAQILNTPVIVVYRFGIYGAGFFVGYFVLSHDEVMERLEKCWLPLAVCAVILAVVFTVMYWGRPYAEHAMFGLGEAADPGEEEIREEIWRLAELMLGTDALRQSDVEMKETGRMRRSK